MKINGKNYGDPVLNYAAIRKLNRVGLDIFKAESDPFSMLDAYVYLATGAKSLEQAQEELSDHLDNGGSIDEVATAMGALIENSSFFQKLKVQQEPEGAKA